MSGWAIVSEEDAPNAKGASSSGWAVVNEEDVPPDYAGKFQSANKLPGVAQPNIVPQEVHADLTRGRDYYASTQEIADRQAREAARVAQVRSDATARGAPRVTPPPPLTGWEAVKAAAGFTPPQSMTATLPGVSKGISSVQSAVRGQGWKAGSEALEAAGEVATPFVGPAVLDVAAAGSLPAALKFGAAIGASAGLPPAAQKISEKLGAGPAQQQFWSNLAAWAPLTYAALRGGKAGAAPPETVSAPEGGPTPGNLPGGGAAPMPFARPGAEPQISPAQSQQLADMVNQLPPNMRGKAIIEIHARTGNEVLVPEIGKDGVITQVRMKLTEVQQPPPPAPAGTQPPGQTSILDAAVDQTVRGPLAAAANSMAQAEANATQAKMRAAGIPPLAPPMPAPPPRVHEVPDDLVKKAGDKIEAMPPDQRGQAIIAAHEQLAKELLQQGKIIVNGKLEIIKNPDQADSVAQKLINDEIAERDKVAAAKPTAKEGTGPALGEATRSSITQTRAGLKKGGFEVVAEEPKGVVWAGEQERGTPAERIVPSETVAGPSATPAGSVPTAGRTEESGFQVVGEEPRPQKFSKGAKVVLADGRSGTVDWIGTNPQGKDVARVRDEKGVKTSVPVESLKAPTQESTKGKTPLAAEGNAPQHVLWSRHGETELDVDATNETVAGWTKEPLDDRGIASAKKLAEEVREHKPTVIISSDLERAKQTADIVGKELGVPVKTDPRLRPQHVPETEGLKVGAAKPIWQDFEDNPNKKPEGGESWKEFEDRQAGAIKDIHDLVAKGEMPMVVTHSRNLESAIGERPEPGEFVKKEVEKPKGNVPLENLGFDHSIKSGPDIGAKARVETERRMGGPLPRGATEKRVAERRSIDRPAQAEADRLFAQARKELGEGASYEQIASRVKELKGPAHAPETEKAISSKPESGGAAGVVKEENQAAGVPPTGPAPGSAEYEALKARVASLEGKKAPVPPTKKPVTPQVEPGYSYGLPSFVGQGAGAGAGAPKPPEPQQSFAVGQRVRNTGDQSHAGVITKIDGDKITVKLDKVPSGGFGPHYTTSRKNLESADEFVQSAYKRQKTALTRAENLSDPKEKRAAVLAAAQQAVKEWGKNAWPDDWSRWQRALDSVGIHTQLEDLENASAADLQHGPLVIKTIRGTTEPVKAPKPPESALPQAVNAAIARGEKPIVNIPPESGAAALANAVYNKLSAGESLGNVTELNALAEKHFGSARTSGSWSPKDAFDAMEAGINKYLLDHGKALMKQDVGNALDFLRALMPKITSQGVRTEEQIKNQQFSTPPTESFIVAKVAALKPSDVVLEPSAGNGGLAVWPKAIGAEVHVNEIAPRRQEMLQVAGFGKPTAHDGEIINSLLDPKIKPTVILMNPPFSASTQKSYEAANRSVYGFNHVESALQRLEEGGRLVAILGGGQANEPEGGASLTGGQSGAWFDKIGKKYNIRANVRVNGKEYAKYGTSFATRIIVIDKDGPTQFHSRGGMQWFGVVQKNVDTLEEAYNALKGVEESRPNVTEQPNRNLVANPEPGVPSVREGAGRSGTTHGEVPATVPGRAESEPRAPASRPEGGTGAVRVSEQESEPRKPAEVEATGRAGGSVENGHPERQVAGAGLDLEEVAAKAQREEEDEKDSSYVAYKPTLKGASHPGSIVETKAMATVPMPPLTYKPDLPESVIGKAPDYTGSKLSAVQLEAVSIAGMQNDIKLPGGYRASALIGDGTGVGKGREGAAILWDNWRKGRKRLVWMSKSKDLMQDAIRDLEGIGAKDLAASIRSLGKTDASTPIDHQGVLFTTYSLFRSGDKKGNTRAAQIDKWLRGEDGGDGGYMLMDESHNLKNAVVSKGQEASQVGEAVKKFLDKMPALRTVSLSATAATDVMNLGYLDRLGLWGPGTPFPGGFSQFAGEISHGGMSAMEMIARELKSQGKYVSRTLTYKGVKYSEIEHTITEDQKKIYATAATAWRSIQESIEKTIKETTNGGARQKALAMSQFYSTQQRFFGLLLSSMKIPTTVAEAEKALAAGKSVAITLINTNEAAQNREKNRVATEDSEEEPDYDFGPGRLLKDMVMEHYPVQQYKDDVDANGNPIKTAVYVKDADGNDTNVPVLNPEAVKARDALVEKLEKELHMPANPLDELIEQLGGPTKVAELTGRKQRYDPATNKLVNRGGNGVSQDKINKNEEGQFQSGKKRIAILSSAADTGISLHADKGAANQQQRFVITHQVGWSADKAMQMNGRFNRSNQTSAPEYALLKSDLGGESRFISSIARRMESLEALSKGQTKTNAGTDAMSKVNFETDQGRAATVAFYNQLLRNVDIPGTEDAEGKMLSGMDVLDKLGVLKASTGGGKTVPPKERDNITRLLNRLLALEPTTQNAVYDYFYDIFDAVVKDAIENGTIDTGVKRIPGDEFNVKEFRPLASDPTTGAKTFYYPVEAQERAERMPAKKFEEMIDKADRQDKHPVVMKHKENGKLLLAIDAKPIVRANGQVDEAVHVMKPEAGVPVKVTAASLYKWEALDAASRKQLEKAQKEITAAKGSIEYYEKEVAKAKASEQKEEERGYGRNYGSPAYYQRFLDEAKDKLASWRTMRDTAKRELKDRDYLDQVKADWQKQHEEAPTHTSKDHHLVGGAVMKYWNAIREATGERMEVYSTVDQKTGQRVVGIEIPAGQIQKLISRISGGKSLITPEQIIPDVLKNSTTYDLEGGIKISRGRVGRESVVKFTTSDANIQRNLKDMGVIHEIGIQPIYYLPTNESKAGTILDKILKQYPVKQEAAAEAKPEPDRSGERGSVTTAGLVEVPIAAAVAVSKAAGAVGDYIRSEAHLNKIARQLQSGMYDLEAEHSGRVLEAVQTMEQVAKEYGDRKADFLGDAEQVYFHQEDPVGITLDKNQDDLLDDKVLPLMEDTDNKFKALKEIDGQQAKLIDNYVHRVTKGKGGWLDRIVSGMKKGTGRGNLLSKSAPQTKGRTMMAIENPDGDRRVISIKGGKATMWDNGQPLELGEIKNAKGRTSEENETFPEGQENSAFYDEGKIVEGPDGYDWKITQATTKEIEANTGIQYYHNALASALVSNLQVSKALRGAQFIEAFKASPQFKEIAFKGAKPPDGWKITQLPQMKDYFFEPHVAEVLDWYADRLKGGDPSIMEKVGQFLRTSIFFNPLIHIPNITVHWAVERGLTGYNPARFPDAAKAGLKAINAVIHQNQDFLDALEAGAPLQSHREDVAKVTQLFFDQLTEGLEKKQDWALKLAKQIGMSPVTLIKGIYRFSGKATWVTNDIAVLQSAYEKMQRSPQMSLADALKETSKHIPDYRLPTRMLNSRALAKVLSNPNISMFMAYHYGAAKSYGEAAKSAIGMGGGGEEPPAAGGGGAGEGGEAGEGGSGKRSKAGEIAHGWEILATIGLVTFVLYPLLDKLVQAASGDKNAKMRRAGAATLPYNVYMAVTHQKSAGDVIQSVATPAVQTKVTAELIANRDFFTGKNIYDPTADWYTQGQQVGRRLAESVSPIGQASRMVEGGAEARKRFGWGLVGVSFPKTRAEHLAAQIAMQKTGTKAPSEEDREDYVERRDLLDELRKGNRRPLMEAERKHEITPQQAHTIARRARRDPLVDTVYNFSIPEVRKVLEAAKADDNQQQVELLLKVIREKRLRMLMRGEFGKAREAEAVLQ
jgi:broad specificity phosphatase PhoE